MTTARIVELEARVRELEEIANLAGAFMEEIQEDHPAVDPVRLLKLNLALDKYYGRT